uniref:Uncharacterized protein n=1 Tax=Rhizophora mucronata TaxID=61149 RepID=A0A2P2NVK6_RHIMU
MKILKKMRFFALFLLTLAAAMNLCFRFLGMLS